MILLLVPVLLVAALTIFILSLLPVFPNLKLWVKLPPPTHLYDRYSNGTTLYKCWLLEKPQIGVSSVKILYKLGLLYRTIDVNYSRYITPIPEKLSPATLAAKRLQGEISEEEYNLKLALLKRGLL